uniref:Uncharacterized protein n=1 Tax=Rhizophora mucronata TaxID=61149 RepID=A0A2P2R300_RHIMU
MQQARNNHVSKQQGQKQEKEKEGFVKEKREVNLLCIQ